MIDNGYENEDQTWRWTALRWCVSNANYKGARMIYKRGAIAETAWCSNEQLIAIGVVDEEDELDPDVQSYQFLPGILGK